jgi:hypothetical protein
MEIKLYISSKIFQNKNRKPTQNIFVCAVGGQLTTLEQCESSNIQKLIDRSFHLI